MLSTGEGRVLVVGTSMTPPIGAIRSSGRASKWRSCPAATARPDLQRGARAAGASVAPTRSGSRRAPTLAGAFVRERLFDELVVYLAPSLLGQDARPLLDLPALAQLDAAHARCASPNARTVGDDLRITAVQARRR